MKLLRHSLLLLTFSLLIPHQARAEAKPSRILQITCQVLELLSPSRQVFSKNLRDKADAHGLKVSFAMDRESSALRHFVESMLLADGQKLWTDADLTQIASYYRSHHGQFIVVRNKNGAIVGTTAFARFSADTAELKRVYLDPSVRGIGLARKLVEEVMSKASRRGYTRMRLTTNTKSTDAIRLYTLLGFKEVWEESSGKLLVMEAPLQATTGPHGNN
jgi:GNAT superfamily N-acetyltransferase